MTTIETPSWETGTLSTQQLETVLTDALADLWADAYRRDASGEFRQRHFRERLETLVTDATGTALCGLPATIRKAEAVPLAAVPDTHRSLDEGGHPGHRFGGQR